MELQFEPIRLDQQEVYLERLSDCPQVSSDYSFVNLWTWAEEYGLSWAWTDSLVWIRQTLPTPVYWAPIGPWADIDWDLMMTDSGLSLPAFVRVPEKLLSTWKRSIKKRLTIEEDRGQWDYLYDISELVTLKGKRFHKKKNLLKQFRNKYKYHFLSFHEGLISRILDMQEAWCVWRDCQNVDSLSRENRAIQRVLNNWRQFKNLSGGAIIVEKEVAAYTIGERLDEHTVIIHFEKGDAEFKGVYQAINQLYLESLVSNPLFQEITWVNREQDINDEGLRKAKLSYHPVDFLKKFQVQVHV